MKYLSEILWLLSWPVLIFAAWQLCAFAVRKFEKREKEA
jgi:hypothetical protein